MCSICGSLSRIVDHFSNIFLFIFIHNKYPLLIHVVFLKSTLISSHSRLSKSNPNIILLKTPLQQQQKLCQLRSGHHQHTQHFTIETQIHYSFDAHGERRAASGSGIPDKRNAYLLPFWLCAHCTLLFFKQSIINLISVELLVMCLMLSESDWGPRPSLALHHLYPVTMYKYIHKEVRNEIEVTKIVCAARELLPEPNAMRWTRYTILL